ncbi:MAG: hypothetical protein ABIT83_16210 [Massilia sp.]
MSTHLAHEKRASDDLDERKAQLLRQGDFYRVSLVHSKAQLKHAARPETLFHSAVDHATFALRSRVDGLLKPTGVSVASMMPYALSILGFIRRRRLGKPALGVAVALGGLAWYLQHRRTAQLQTL